MPNPILTVLAFDYGTRKIGVAMGETITKVAKPLCSIKVRSNEPDWDHISDIIRQYSVNLCVVGLPLNMDGSRQPMTGRAEAFARALEQRTGLGVQLIDERLSSIEARSLVFSEKKTGKRNKLKQHGIVDAYAAKIILDHWFNS